MPETSLLELDLEGLIGVMEELGQPAYRARQVYRQIWQRGALDPTEMSDLPRELRAELAARTADRADAAGDPDQRRRLDDEGARAAGRRRDG